MRLNSGISSASSRGLFWPAIWGGASSLITTAALAPLGALETPLTALGAATGDAEDGPFSRAGVLFAGLPELVLIMTPGAFIGGLGTEALGGRLTPPANDGRMTEGTNFSGPVDLGGCCDALRCGPS